MVDGREVAGSAAHERAVTEVGSPEAEVSVGHSSADHVAAGIPVAEELEEGDVAWRDRDTGIDWVMSDPKENADCAGQPSAPRRDSGVTDKDRAKTRRRKKSASSPSSSSLSSGDTSDERPRSHSRKLGRGSPSPSPSSSSGSSTRRGRRGRSRQRHLAPSDMTGSRDRDQATIDVLPSLQASTLHNYEADLCAKVSVCLRYKDPRDVMR